MASSVESFAAPSSVTSSSAGNMKKLVIVISHPIQYHAPLYTRIAQRHRFDLQVIFHNDRGVRSYFDPLANATVAYDNNLLDGYAHEFLTRASPKA